MNRTRIWLPLLGLGLAAACFAILPDAYRDSGGRVVPFSLQGRMTLALMVLMGTWWLTECVSMSVTALLPVTLFPLLGIASLDAAAAPYANPLVFLYLGGFLLALAMQRCGLDRRLALRTLTATGSKPRGIVGGFMLATATLSAFVSNTATTAVMLPIALGVLRFLVEDRDGRPIPRSNTPGGVDETAPCLMLGIAYAASIGGMTTIVGSPTNLFLVGFLRDSIAPEYRRDLGFMEWLRVGVPITCLFLPAAWWLLTRSLFRLPSESAAQGGQWIRDELARLGPMSFAERITLATFLITAVCWITRPVLASMTLMIGEQRIQPLAGLTDPGIALLAALALFLIPAEPRSARRVLDWETAEQVPWGILILFGGGLSLAEAVADNGVADYLASWAGPLSALPHWLIVACVTALVLGLTEFTSNVASTATVIPILAALAPEVGLHPYLLVFPATMAASCAFMLPVATPPNAMVFAGGHITLPQMVRAGLWMNLLGWVIIVSLTWWIVPRLFLAE